MDVYYQKAITYPFKGIKFEFDVASELFSSFAIDHGTDLLIRNIATNNPKNILDLGCGYGPIGIILAKTNPDAQVTLVDVNLLAVKYTNINIEKNKIDNAKAIGSIGMESVQENTYDLVTSNIPAKIEDEAIEKDFILTPYNNLQPNGELWIVVVSGLNRLIPRIGKNNKLDMKLIKKRKGHSLYRIKKASF